MRSVLRLFVHCSGTPNGRPVRVREIDMWHAARCSPRWEKSADGAAVYTPADMSPREEAAVQRFNPAFPYIGYHGFIDLDGQFFPGRAESEPGSHAGGYNMDSIAVCLAGTNRYTPEQWQSLRDYIDSVEQRYGDIDIVGHNEYTTRKSCPGFSVPVWVASGFVPLPEHVL